MTVSVLATPRVLAATPSGGPLRGGDVIVVAGENFVGVEPAACRIADRRAAGRPRLRTPPRSAGRR